MVRMSSQRALELLSRWRVDVAWIGVIMIAFARPTTGSITAFLVGQMIDISVFQAIRRVTGERWVWLRATGSTLVSQCVDSFVVLYIAFVLGPQHWPTSLFLAVGTVNYAYKSLMAFAMIPVIYLVRRAIRAYLGNEEAAALESAAASRSST